MAGISTRIINKHDTEARWAEATDFIPLDGELIIYDPDSTHDYARVKIGDGETPINDLPFIDEALASDIQSKLNGKAASSHTHTIANVTGLQSALDGKAASSHGTHVSYSSTAPVMDGTASVGSATTVARSDHKHPTDTSRASKTDFDSHSADTTKHVTSSERTNWNAAYTHSTSTHAPSNAQANQNAFSNVKVGSTTIAADTTTDTLTLVGSNVTLTPDATNDKVTIGITKDNVTAALGYTPPTKDTTYSAAGSSLGLVKSGGDVTISSGVITVNDDSHNHTIANVDNLQTALDGKADKSQGVIYIEGAGTTDTTNKVATWTGTHSDITEYYSGLTILYKVATAGSTTTTLNINNLGAVSVVRNATTAISTACPVNGVLLLTYTTDSDGTSYWKTADYDSNTKTTTGTSNKTGTKLYLAGATSQSSSGATTYSNSKCYVGTDNCLYSNSAKVATSAEVTTVSDNIQTQLDSKSDTSHSHQEFEILNSLTEVADVVHRSINLNPGGYEYGTFKGATGAETNLSPVTLSFRSIDYIPVEGGNSIAFYYDKASWNNNNRGQPLKVVEYDSSKNILVSTSAQLPYAATDRPSLALNPDTKYIRFAFDNYTSGAIANYPLEDIKVGIYYLEDAVLEYVEYETVESVYMVRRDRVNELEPLRGKKIVYDGDSICESRLSANINGGGYAKIIADYVGGVYTNAAVGGARLTSDSSRHSVVDNVANLPTDGDLYCFQGGINDFWGNVAVGEVSADYTSTVDATTICGALETIFRYCLTNFVGKPICFIITHNVKNTATVANTNGVTFKGYRDAMIKVCEKYSIPYYDAFAESGLNGWNTAQSNAYLTANSSGTGDGTHPNEEGYKRYYVPQLLDLFRRIMPLE